MSQESPREMTDVQLLETIDDCLECFTEGLDPYRSAGGRMALQRLHACHSEAKQRRLRVRRECEIPPTKSLRQRLQDKVDEYRASGRGGFRPNEVADDLQRLLQE